MGPLSDLYATVCQTSVADPDPGSFAFLTPGSRIRIRDLGWEKIQVALFFCIRWRKARANSSDNKKGGLFDLFLLFHVFQCTVPFFDFTMCSIFWEWSENRQDGLFVFFLQKVFFNHKFIICRLVPEGKLSVSNSHEQDLPGDRATRQYWGNNVFLVIIFNTVRENRSITWRSTGVVTNSVYSTGAWPVSVRYRMLSFLNLLILVIIAFCLNAVPHLIKICLFSWIASWWTSSSLWHLCGAVVRVSVCANKIK